MRYKRLGKSGLRVSELCLGTKYTDAAPGNDPNAAGNHRKSMMQAVEASLKRLRTDYIDLYWLHIWDQITPIAEVMRAFDDLVRQGKILYAGVCNMPAWIVAKANTLAELRGWTAFVGLQIEYSVIERTPERDLLPMAADLGLGVTAWSPLAGGLLTGKHMEAGGAKDSRQNHPAIQQFMQPDARKGTVAREVVAVAHESGHSPAQVALAWLRQRPDPVIPIIGARQLAQVKDNLACVGVQLTTAHIERLDAVSRIEMGAPHDLFATAMVRSLSAGGMRDQIDA